MSKPIELAVLDMAGTTIRDDDAVNQCLRDSLQDSGIQVTRDEVNEVMGLPKPAAIQALIESKAARAPAEGQVDALHKGFVERMVKHYRTSSAVEPMPFAVQVLTELRRNQIKVFLNTGFSRPIVSAILERLGWTDSSLVDGVVASDEVRHGRPHADMIIRAMALSGVQDCKAVAKVGDTPSDLHEGAAAGCGLIIGVTNGTHTREQLMPHPHTHLIMSLEPLPKLILDTHLKPVVL